MIAFVVTASAARLPLFRKANVKSDEELKEEPEED
jgi:hypothetical protein